MSDDFQSFPPEKNPADRPDPTPPSEEPAPPGGARPYDAPPHSAAPGSEPIYEGGPYESDPAVGRPAQEYAEEPTLVDIPAVAERPVPPPASPPPADNSRRNLFIALGAGFLLLTCVVCGGAAVVLTMMAPASSTTVESDDGSTAPVIIDGEAVDPSPTEVPGVTTSVMRLNVGDCFNDAEVLEDGSIRELDIIPCEVPHDNEIFASLTYPAADDAPFPGDEELDVFWEPACTERFEEFVGIAYNESAFYITTLEPTEGSWARDDREILCILYEPDVKLEGSMEGAAR